MLLLLLLLLMWKNLRSWMHLLLRLHGWMSLWLLVQNVLLLLLLLLHWRMRGQLQRCRGLGLHRASGPMGARSGRSTDWRRLKDFLLQK